METPCLWVSQGMQEPRAPWCCAKEHPAKSFSVAHLWVFSGGFLCAAAMHQVCSGAEALLSHACFALPRTVHLLSAEGRVEASQSSCAISVEIPHHIQSHAGTVRNREKQKAKPQCLDLFAPFSKEGIHLAHSAMSKLRMGTFVFLHTSLLCILAVSHHIEGQLCFSSCFPEQRPSPDWLIFPELDASFELMLIFATCLLVLIPSESTSVSSRGERG